MNEKPNHGDDRFVISIWEVLVVANPHDADHERKTIRVSGIEVYDPIRPVNRETAYRRWVDKNGQEMLKIASLSWLCYTTMDWISSNNWGTGIAVL